MARLGFIGPGQLGGPMVERLLAAGHELTVHARRPNRRDELSALGAVVVDDPRAAARDAELLICCTFSDSQLRAALIDDGALAAMVAGTAVVSHVTGDPVLVDELAALAPAGVAIVDAPVSGTAEQIRHAALTVLIGGDGAVVERVTAVIGAYADPVIHVGRRGDALRAKIINNILFAANVRLAGEVHRVASAMRMDFDVLVGAIDRCSGSTAALNIASAMGNERLQTGSRPFLEKDVAVVAEVARTSGIDLGELLRVAAVYLPEENRANAS